MSETQAYKSGRFVVYVSTRATASLWKHAARATVVSFRQQQQGMGSATIRLEQIADAENAELNWVPQANDWAVIIDSTRMPAFWNVPYEQDVRSLMDAENHPVRWVGRVGMAPIEQHVGSVDSHGGFEFSEVGFFLLGQPITRDYVHPGYNPTIDDRHIGNWYDDETLTGRLSRIPAEWGDPESTGYAWTPRRILIDLCENGLAIKVRTVFTPSSALLFLDDPFSAPSYEGQSLVDAAQELLNPLSFRFVLSNEEGYALDMVITSPMRTTEPPPFADAPPPPSGPSGASGPSGPPDPADPTTLDVTDTPCRIVTLTRSEDSYDRIVLRGQRIEIAATITTFGPRRVSTVDTLRTPILHPSFTPGEAGIYAKAVEWTPSTWDIDTYLEEQEIELDSDEADDEVSRLDSINRAKRDQYSEVYQQFNFLYDTDDLNVEGNAALYNPVSPGLVVGVAPVGYTHTTAYPTFAHQYLFPRFRLQNLDTFQLFFTPEILANDHATPNPASFEVLPHVPIYDEEGNPQEPTLFVRGMSRWDPQGELYDLPDYRYPLWFDISQPGTNKQTVSWSVNGIGLTLDAPYPELLGCGDPMLWHDRFGVDGANVSDEFFWGQPEDRGEWSFESEDQGYTARHPDYFRFGSQSFWPDRGHWMRMVATVGLLSDQRYEVFYENPGDLLTVEKEKVVEDPELHMTVQLQGTVTGIQVGFNDGQRSLSELVHSTADTFISRRTTTEANRTLWALWEWYNKTKQAISVEWSLMHEPGQEPIDAYQPVITIGAETEPIEVGMLIDELIDENPDPLGLPVVTAVNTQVSTIEVFVEDEAPRTVVTTDIPSAPPMSRFRRMQLGGG